MQCPEKPPPDEGAHDAEDDVPEESEAKTAHDIPGQPAGDRADNQHGDDALYFHDVLPATAGHEARRHFAMQLRMQLRKRSPSRSNCQQPPARRWTTPALECPRAAIGHRYCDATSNAADWSYVASCGGSHARRRDN